MLAMAVNLVLAGYIEYQKNVNIDALRDECFVGGGCSTVQTSVYATTFGLSNPHWGYIGFSTFLVFFTVLLLSTFSKRLFNTLHQNRLYIHGFLIIGLTIGALFSSWLLYIQYFVIHATCIYCLWVDSIMIATWIIYVFVFEKLL